MHEFDSRHVVSVEKEVLVLHQNNGNDGLNHYAQNHCFFLWKPCDTGLDLFIPQMQNPSQNVK